MRRARVEHLGLGLGCGVTLVLKSENDVFRFSVSSLPPHSAETVRVRVRAAALPWCWKVKTTSFRFFRFFSLPRNENRETCVLRSLFIKYMIFKPQVYEIWKAINGQNNMRIIHSVLSQFYIPKWPRCMLHQ